MKYALVNPNWSFEGSIYFGCREPHLPLEYGYSKALLEQAGHEAFIVDAQLENLPLPEVQSRVAAFGPDFTVVTTAPSYLFWRCAPPELRVPQEMVRALRPAGGALVAVGPHASTTPKTTLRKLGVDAVVLGECEDILPQLANPWSQAHSICYLVNGEPGCRVAPMPQIWRSCPRSAGLRTWCAGIIITITASMPLPPAPARRWKPRAAALTIAPSAPRTIFATATAAARYP
jgi:Fe-S oxidoreductase